MNIVFADAGYWIALLYTSDSLHGIAQTIHRSTIATGQLRIITSEMVLTELALLN